MVICAAPFCTNDISDIVKPYEEKGRRGRPPKFCRDPAELDVLTNEEWAINRAHQDWIAQRERTPDAGRE
jgi:hypothetical protein